MPRELTGSRWERNRRFYAGLPERRGGRGRVEASFATSANRDSWLNAGLAALRAGRPLPDPDLYRNGRAPAEVAIPPSSAEVMPTFEELAHGWLDEYYAKLKNGNAERARDVYTMVELHLIPGLGGPIPADPREARKRLVAFVRRLALEPEWEDPLRARPGAAEPSLLTITEAVAASERSEATLRRALRAGRLPGAHRGTDGAWLIPVGDLAAGGLLGPRRARVAVSRAYASDILWAHAKILEWGRTNGWNIADFARGVHALTPDDEVARTPQGSDLRRPLSIAEIARVASHLHVVHQLVLWQMRVLGLRISEAFGVRVGDIVDVGEVGLVFITRQGGRPFLTRTRDGVVTRFSKATLKRAASYRVLVVPPALLAVFHAAIDAFHTDPVSGDVDLDARMVPWIVKEDRGQTAFRAALEGALLAEGFSLDASGFEVTTHDLRKSLATDLAWNADLDELAKRRVMGHKAGDDVFARIYTLDHPSIAPLAAVAAAIQADVTANVTTLLVPTEARVSWGAHNPCRARTAHINAVLADAGWQVEPGDTTNPWCDTARVAAELAVAPTTARRWMRDQVVPSTTDNDRFANPRRRARLSDVHATRDRLAARLLLRDVAEDLGVGYHPAWHALNRLGIEPARDPRTDELMLDAEQETSLRAEFERLSALKDRSMRLSTAATRLGVAVSTVLRFLQAGELEEDPETDPSRARYVTRTSVEALRAARSRRGPPIVETDVLPLSAVAHMTGLKTAQISELIGRGILRRSDIGRRSHVTTESLRSWAVGYRPDLLRSLEFVNRSDSDEEGVG
jgi:integrase